MIATLKRERVNIQHDQTQQMYQGLGIDPRGLSVQEQLSQLKLDWQPKTSPIRYGELYEHETSSAHALYRPTDGQFMGIISDDWFSECQSFENILNTFNEFCKKSGLNLERVGVIETLSRKNKQGHQQLYLKLFAAASGFEDFDLGDGDFVNPKLMLISPYYYGQGYQQILSAYRMICTNGLHEKLKSVAITRHSGKTTIGNIQANLEGVNKIWEKKKEQLEILASSPLSIEDAATLIIDEFGYPERSWDEQPKIVKSVLELYSSKEFIGAHYESARETAWGLVNCVTQYLQHIQVSVNPNTQLNSVWQGTKQKQTSDFLQSISAFATERRNREQRLTTAQTVAVRAF